MEVPIWQSNYLDPEVRVDDESDFFPLLIPTEPVVAGKEPNLVQVEDEGGEVRVVEETAAPNSVDPPNRHFP